MLLLTLTFINIKPLTLRLESERMSHKFKSKLWLSQVTPQAHKHHRPMTYYEHSITLTATGKLIFIVIAITTSSSITISTTILYSINYKWYSYSYW